MMLHNNYQCSMPCGFRPEDFQSFHLENLFLACVTWICYGQEPFEQLYKECYIRIIPAKFGQYPASSLGGYIL